MERATREVWAKRVERWKDSGLTAKEFAAELDVSASSLTYWKWKLGRLASGAPEKAGVRRKARSETSAQASAKFLLHNPSCTATSLTPRLQYAPAEGLPNG